MIFRRAAMVRFVFAGDVKEMERYAGIRSQKPSDLRCPSAGGKTSYACRCERRLGWCFRVYETTTLVVR